MRHDRIGVEGVSRKLICWLCASGCCVRVVRPLFENDNDDFSSLLKAYFPNLKVSVRGHGIVGWFSLSTVCFCVALCSQILSGLNA